MSGSMSRNKGQRGELEALTLVGAWLAPVYTAAGLAPPTLERNLMQSRAGGYDVVGVDWLALEVKRHENVQLGSWWKQAIRQAKPGQVPFLMWRGNRQPWRFRVRIATAHPTAGDLWATCAHHLDADLSQDQARAWIEREAWWRLQS